MSTITKEFTKERLEEIAEDGFLKHGESKALARIALASLEAGKVVLYRERNPYNGLTTGWQELTEDEYEFIKNNAGENAEFRTVYTAPPAPVTVPDEVISAIENLKRTLVNCNRYNYCSDAVKRIENACRAAMLQGADGNSPVIGEGRIDEAI